LVLSPTEFPLQTGGQLRQTVVSCQCSNQTGLNPPAVEFIDTRHATPHRFTALDDFSEISLARLSADGFKPCALVETSASNFQVWLKHPKTFPKLLGTFAAQTLAERYDADLKLAQIPSKREMATILECEVNSARAFRPRNGLWVSAESNGNNVERFETSYQTHFFRCQFILIESLCAERIQAAR
jgi:hypothetical protein